MLTTTLFEKTVMEVSKDNKIILSVKPVMEEISGEELLKTQLKFTNQIGALNESINDYTLQRDNIQFELDSINKILTNAVAAGLKLPEPEEPPPDVDSPLLEDPIHDGDTKPAIIEGEIIKPK